MPRSPIEDLNSLPFPDRSLINYDLYSKYRNDSAVANCISILATRGCPFGCTYCHKIWPQKHVFRSAENIIEEIKIYYDMGIKRFTFIDDIFNFNRKNSERFFELLIRNNLKIDLFFTNGTRGDIMDKDYIDLMVEAGTVYIPMALETASPRLQKLIKKNLNIDKLHENLTYLCEKHPNVISGLYFMVGFPTETEEEAMSTLDFVKSIKWIHFPEMYALTIYSGTEIEQLALSQGITKEMILRNETKGVYELPETLPFKDKSFVTKLRILFLKEYWLKKERIIKVLPGQMKVMTEGEIVRFYNNWVNAGFKNIEDLLNYFKIPKKDIGQDKCLDESTILVQNLHCKMKEHFSENYNNNDNEQNRLNVLLLDISHGFSTDESNVLTDFVQPPIGLMYLATYLNRELGDKINCKIAKSFIDFDSYDDLLKMIEEFKPDVIGIRCLTFYKNFLREITGFIKKHINVPILAGGPHATCAYEDVLKDADVDVAVIGEGELTLKELVEKIIENDNTLPDESILKEIAGIVFKEPAGNAKSVED